MAVVVVGYLSNGVFHHPYPIILVLVKFRDYEEFQLIVEVGISLFILYCSLGIWSGNGPIAQPVRPSTQPSIHHPSSTLKFTMPLCAAFIPLVPEASVLICIFHRPRRESQ
jgi:hypothetical protein